MALSEVFISAKLTNSIISAFLDCLTKYTPTTTYTILLRLGYATNTQLGTHSQTSIEENTFANFN